MHADRFITTRRLTMAAALAAAALIGSGPATAAKPAKDDGRVAVGKPLDCIQSNRIRTTNVRDDSTIDFEMDNGDIYRNVLPNSCPSLGSERRFSYKTSISQLCSVDVVTVLYSMGSGLSPGASCGLGKFQKVEKPKP